MVLELLDQANTDTLSPVARFDPELLQFTELAPAAADCATDDMTMFISHEARQCLHFMERGGLVVEVTEPFVNDGALFLGQTVMRFVVELRHGVSPAA